jgi:hypothetical protein
VATKFTVAPDHTRGEHAAYRRQVRGYVAPIAHAAPPAPVHPVHIAETVHIKEVGAVEKKEKSIDEFRVVHPDDVDLVVAQIDQLGELPWMKLKSATALTRFDVPAEEADTTGQALRKPCWTTRRSQQVDEKVGPLPERMSQEFLLQSQSGVGVEISPVREI